jgi:D-sedoheptulose 7-phosphate isomerase
LTKEVQRRALPAIALTTDSSFLTAFANDCGYDGVFERQVEALGEKGDVLLGISTSGSSKNVVQAMKLAKVKGLKCIALIGEGGVMKDLADVAIAVPSTHTQYIQESHLSVEHLICELVERELFSEAYQRKV